MSTPKGRNNRAIWNLVNWDNAYCAIARRLGCDRRSVHYQARKRGLRSGFRQGHSPCKPLPYVEGPNPLPEKIPQL